jgi:hypothetical protein
MVKLKQKVAGRRGGLAAADLAEEAAAVLAVSAAALPVGAVQAAAGKIKFPALWGMKI